MGWPDGPHRLAILADRVNHRPPITMRLKLGQQPVRTPIGGFQNCPRSAQSRRRLDGWVKALHAMLALALAGCGRCDDGSVAPIGDGSPHTEGTSDASGSYPIVTFKLDYTVAFPQRERVAECRPSLGSVTFDELKVQKLAPGRKVARPPFGSEAGGVFELSGTFSNGADEKCFVPFTMFMAGDGRPLGEDGPPTFFAPVPAAPFETNRSRPGVAPHGTLRIIERFVAPEAERRIVLGIDMADDKGNVTWLTFDLEDGHVEKTVANEPRLVPAPPAPRPEP
jgi:hypothetical protein